jgi:hypothetical protein
LSIKALIRRLELAKATFIDDPHRGRSHLSSALAALAELRPGDPETGMTHDDWVHVVDVCISLDPLVMFFGDRPALRDLDHIHYQATMWRDR